MLAHENREAAQASWRAFGTDPDWATMRDESHRASEHSGRPEAAEGRCISLNAALKNHRLAGSNSPGILPPRAWRAERLDALGATLQVVKPVLRFSPLRARPGTSGLSPEISRLSSVVSLESSVSRLVPTVAGGAGPLCSRSASRHAQGVPSVPRGAGRVSGRGCALVLCRQSTVR